MNAEGAQITETVATNHSAKKPSDGHHKMLPPVVGVGWVDQDVIAFRKAHKPAELTVKVSTELPTPIEGVSMMDGWQMVVGWNEVIEPYLKKQAEEAAQLAQSPIAPQQAVAEAATSDAQGVSSAFAAPQGTTASPSGAFEGPKGRRQQKVPAPQGFAPPSGTKAQAANAFSPPPGTSPKNVSDPKAAFAPPPGSKLNREAQAFAPPAGSSKAKSPEVSSAFAPPPGSTAPEAKSSAFAPPPGTTAPKSAFAPPPGTKNPGASVPRPQQAKSPPPKGLGQAPKTPVTGSDQPQTSSISVDKRKIAANRLPTDTLAKVAVLIRHGKLEQSTKVLQLWLVAHPGDARALRMLQICEENQSFITQQRAPKAPAAPKKVPGPDPQATPQVNMKRLMEMQEDITPRDAYILSRIDGHTTVAELPLLVPELDQNALTNLLVRSWKKGILKFNAPTRPLR